jgi:hypothetical protein
MEQILAALPIARAHFPLKYLGLPLSPKRLRKLANLTSSPSWIKRPGNYPCGSGGTSIKLAGSASPNTYFLRNLCIYFL